MTETNDHTRKYYPRGKNRNVYCDEYGRLVYEYLTKGVKAYCTFHPVLCGILMLTGLSPNYCKKRGIRFRLQKHSDIIRRCELHLLCYACYHGYITSLDSWQKEYKEFRDRMNSFRFQIDHADGNQLNCTIYNLSEMNASQNNKKHDITSWIKQPVICHCGYFGDEYRIKVRFPNICADWLKFKCENASDLTNCLHELESLECGYGRPIYYLDVNGLLKKITSRLWKKNRSSVTTANVMNSITGQEQIAWMFDCEFVLYRTGQVKEQFHAVEKKKMKDPA